MKCIFEKNFKKNEEGGLCCFLEPNFRKKRRGDPSSKKRRGKKREKSEGSPLRRFFRKKSDIIPHLRSFSSVNLRVDSESENRFSVQRIFNEIFLGPDPGHWRVNSTAKIYFSIASVISYFVSAQLCYV